MKKNKMLKCVNNLFAFFLSKRHQARVIWKDLENINWGKDVFSSSQYSVTDTCIGKQLKKNKMLNGINN